MRECGAVTAKRPHVPVLVHALVKAASFVLVRLSSRGWLSGKSSARKARCFWAPL